jgi:4,5-dihydroxyphthalate decarboxylase
MAKLRLTCALSDNARTRALLDGSVAPEAIELETKALHPSEMFWRQLKFAEFDVSEMSLSSLTIATAQGPTPWVGIPVFTSRRFFHTGILVRTDRGIDTPADLAGKTVGVPEFQQTAALWTRSVLRDEFGLDPRSMRWFMERNPDQSHGGQTGFTPPAGIDLRYVPRETNLGQMLIDGEVDALLHWIDARNLVDRSSVDPRSDPNVRHLFADRAAEAHRYYAKTGIYPINHGLVVRRSIVERHPWVVLNLYAAFAAAKARLAHDLDVMLEPYAAAGLLNGAAQAFATDPLPYGVQRSRPVLDTIVRAVHADGLATRLVGLDELFAPNTLDL